MIFPERQLSFFSTAKVPKNFLVRFARTFSIYSIAFWILPRARSVVDGNIHTNCGRPKVFLREVDKTVYIMKPILQN